MATKDQIERSIRANCPIIFGDSYAVDIETFKPKYDALEDYASKVSAPFLGAETVRYQSLLLYFSLLVLAVTLFQIGSVKIGDSLVSVDRRLLVIYAMLIGAIIVIFLTKVYLDIQRQHDLRKKYDLLRVELQALAEAGLLKKHIHHYFWLEIFDAIGRTYKAYDDAASAAIGTPPEFKHNPMQVLNFDRAGYTKSPQMKEEIESLDSYLAAVTAELSHDEDRFREEAERILSSTRSQPEDDPILSKSHKVHEAIRVAWGQTLKNWFDARNHLADQLLDHVLYKKPPEIIQLEDTLGILRRTWKIRRIYVWVEIAVPVVFAIFAIVFVQSGSVPSVKSVVP